MKILDFETIRQLSTEVDSSEYYDWINRCLMEKMDFKMPVKSRIKQSDGNYYAIVPSR